MTIYLVRVSTDSSLLFYRPFPSGPKPLFQREAKCEAINMKLIFYSHANKTHFTR